MEPSFYTEARKKKLDELTDHALMTYEEQLLTGSDEKARIAAAKDILDRAEITEKKPAGTSNAGNVNLNLPPEVLQTLFSSLAKAFSLSKEDINAEYEVVNESEQEQTPSLPTQEQQEQQEEGIDQDLLERFNS